MTDLEHAQHMLAAVERHGRFWADLVEFYDQSAAKWDEMSGQRSEREKGWLEADEMVVACRAEWKRWKVRVNAILAKPQRAEG